MTSTEFVKDEWYSTTRVAELFGVTTPTVRDWIKKGKLRAVKRGEDKGARFMVPREDVIALAKEKYG